MLLPRASRLCAQLADLRPGDADYATRCVDMLLSAAREVAASDLHFQPTPAGLELKFRVDGVLTPITTFPSQLAPNIAARLKVLAGLLTYYSDRPQEGRIRLAEDNVEMRVCTFPTLHGERVVVRLFGGGDRLQFLEDLGLPEDMLAALRQLLGETSGAILVSGPAGSGKTTTVYACLREIARQAHGERSLLSIEDPIEVAVDGVAQAQVSSPVGLDLANGLCFLMRQDPEVVMVGEIRDQATAEAAMQASLTGHLMLSTFHAGSAAETTSRLLDLGIEPYVLRSGLLAILNQRLLRRLCNCAERTNDVVARLGLPVESVMVPRGCDECMGSGYRGRLLLVEMMSLSTGELVRGVLARRETNVLQQFSIAAGMISLQVRAEDAVEAGWTSPAEVRRVFGFGARGNRIA